MIGYLDIKGAKEEEAILGAGPFGKEFREGGLRS
jgi:hypothetical protein